MFRLSPRIVYLILAVLSGISLSAQPEYAKCINFTDSKYGDTFFEADGSLTTVSADNVQSYVVHMDSTGNVERSYTFLEGNSSTGTFSKRYITRCGGTYVVAGLEDSCAFIFGFDVAGQVSWSQKVCGFLTSYDNIIGLKSDSSFIYLIRSLASSRYEITKISRTGIVLWSRRYDTQAAISVSAFNAQTKRLLVGSQYGVITEFDSTGSLLWCRTLGFVPNYLCADINDTWLVAGTQSNLGYNSIIARVDPDTLFYQSRTTLPGLSYTHGITTDAQGFVYLSMRGETHPDYEWREHLIKLSPALSMIWTKKATHSVEQGLFSTGDLAISSQNKILMAGAYNESTTWILCSDTTANVKCPYGRDMSLIQYALPNSTSGVLTSTFEVPVTENFQPITMSLTNYYCNTLPICTGQNLLAVTGLYPNPADDRIFIQPIDQDFYLEIYSLTGQQVFAQAYMWGTTEIVLPPDLPMGFYVCNFSYTDGADDAFKLIIRRNR